MPKPGLPVFGFEHLILAAVRLIPDNNGVTIVIQGLQRVFDTIDDIDLAAVFENGRVFWDALECGALKEFDVLVVDIDIPELDGVQIFERILKDRPEIPVIFYTRQPSERNWTCIPTQK